MTRNVPGAGSRRLAGPFLMSASLLAFGLLCTARFPAFWRPVFCAPPSFLAASLLQAPCSRTVDGYFIDLPVLAIRMTDACNATQFFSLLWALMGSVALAVRPRPWKAVALLTAYAGLAFIMTVMANTARVVVGWWAGIWARQALPETFQAGVHLITGILVFTVFLVAGYIVSTRLGHGVTYAGNATA